MSADPAAAPQPHESATARLLRLERIFHQVSDAPQEERSALIDQLCAGDDTFRAELLELLGADSSVGELLAATPAASHLPAQDEDNDPWLGRSVGAFRLERVLGRGGMGVVYLGERHAGTGEGTAASAPRQRAAIKFVRRSLRGSPALAHFNLERDALAALEHPHIARLIDAGVTDESIPFVVMEYVDGQRLDTIADAPATTVPQVVALLIQLSEAVAYVHRHLILHRDLKPGNVMVTGDPGQYQVKLLDFGTLKMLGPDAVESAMTQAGMRPVTLRYASPEHIRGGAVSTASEVYSLGVILYRLIAGRLPEDLDNLPLSEYLDRLAQGRLAPPSSLATKAMDTDLACDLDAIALKAMRFEPEQRYATAEAFAAELRRALEHRPVEARGDGLRYRVGKFYQRNRATLLSGIAAVLVLLAGIVATAREAHIARAQAHLAEAGVDGERRLAHLLLFDYFSKLAAIPGSTDAERKAASNALTYLNGLAGTPAGHATSLELDEVQAYTSMGGLLGNPYEENLGDPGSAVAALQKGEVVAHELSLRLPNDIASLRAEAALEQTLANVYFGDDKPADAARHMRQATAIGDRLTANPAATAADFGLAASMNDGLGDVLGAHETVGTTEGVDPAPIYQHAMDLDRQGLAHDAGCTRCRRGVAVEIYKLGMLREDDDPRAATGFYRQTLAQLATGSAREQASAPFQRLSALVRQRLGMMDVRVGDTAEGLALLLDAQKHMQANLDADPIDTRARFDLASMQSNIADAYKSAGDLPHALDERRSMLRNMEALMRTDPGNKVWQFHHATGEYALATLLKQTGDTAGGNALLRAVLPLLIADAEAPDAAAFVLGATVDAMNDTDTDAKKTLAFAQRYLALTPAPTAGDLTALLQAATRANDAGVAQAAARRLLRQVSDQHLTGPGIAEDVARAQKTLAAH